MKRWTFLIVLCRLLGAPGAVTTLPDGVAWGGDFSEGSAGVPARFSKLIETLRAVCEVRV